MIDVIGGRKVLVGLIILAVGVAIELITAKGLSAQMTELMVYLSMGFFGSNVLVHGAESIVKAKQKAAGRPPVTKVDTSALEATLSEEIAVVKTKVQELKETVGQIQPGSGGDTSKLEKSMKSIINQNAVMHQSLNGLTQGMSAVVSAIQPAQE